MSTVEAYAEMVGKRKEHYLNDIVSLSTQEPTPETLQKLNAVLEEYVILDLTYRKLLDLVW